MAEAIIFNPGYPNLLMENDVAGIRGSSADPAQFEHIFKTHFRNLHAYANNILKDEDSAEEIVQNVFYKLWEKKEKISIEQSVAAYLYRAVYNECLNFLKHEKVKTGYEFHSVHNTQNDAFETDSLILKELRQKIDRSLNELPEQCRAVFQMSRFEGLKYIDIAARLGISVKTVENHMGKALRVLRTKLLEYLPILVLIFINVNNLIR